MPLPKGRNNILKQRFRKSKIRYLVVVDIAKINPKGRKLFSGSVFPASVFGHQAYGIDQDDIETLEIRGAQCTGHNSSRDRFITNCIAYGPHS